MDEDGRMKLKTKNVEKRKIPSLNYNRKIKVVLDINGGDYGR